MQRLWKALAVLIFAATGASAQSQGKMPDYTPEQKLADCETIRSWGSNDMAELMKSWEAGFRKYHPGVRFASTLKGSETAQAALYAEVADLALMDREILLIERHVMLRRKHHLPLEIKVTTGSYDGPTKTCALAVFVHRDNPITRFTVKQLDGIFGDQRTGAWDDKFRWHPELARSALENLRTWGQLGLKGEWADKPIQTYGYPITSYSPLPGPVLSFRAVAFGGGDMWNPNLLEFEKGEQITDALSKDRYGIAYTCLSYKTPQIKPTALASADGGSYFELTKANVASRKYPLTRSTYIYIDRSPEKPVDPKVKEFLRYVLSSQGQEDVARNSGYLPLTTEEVREQLKKLE